MAMIVPSDTRSSWARCGVCRIDRHGSPPPKTVPPGLGPATGPAPTRSALAGPPWGIASSRAARGGAEGAVGLLKWLGSWPVIRQVQQGDLLGLGKAAQSPRSAALSPRTADADRVARPVWPHCAVGRGQKGCGNA